MGFLAVVAIPLWISEQTLFRPLMMCSGALALIMGTLVSFKYDAHDDRPWMDLIMSLIRQPYPFVYLAVAIGVTSWLSGPNNWLPEGMAVFYVGIETAILMLLIGAIGLLQRLIDTLIDVWMLTVGAGRTSNRFPAHGVGLFSVYLTVDHSLDVQTAGELSSCGTMLNMESLLILTIILPLICAIWLSSLFFIPFMYCFYREIFYGPGLAVKQVKAKKDADSVVATLEHRVET